MKLHTKNGTLSTEYGEFLPALELSEYEVNEDDFKAEIVKKGKGVFEKYVTEGEYIKVTANIKVTRYYPKNS